MFSAFPNAEVLTVGGSLLNPSSACKLRSSLNNFFFYHIFFINFSKHLITKAVSATDLKSSNVWTWLFWCTKTNISSQKVTHHAYNFCYFIYVRTRVHKNSPVCAFQTLVNVASLYQTFTLINRLHTIIFSKGTKLDQLTLKLL